MNEWHEHDRFSDDGCPNFFIEENSTPIVPGTVQRLKRFNRKHRNAIHLVTFIVVAYFIAREGFRAVDTSALGMAIVTELLP